MVRRVAFRFPVRLRWALVLVVLFHGSLLAFGSFRGTYDAYVHLFLADHYARDWFSTWDQRWYTGFTTVSYPPGTHMALAAVSMVVGLSNAFPVVQLAVLLLLAVGMYRYARMWVGERAASNAALLLVLSSTIAQTVHLYGQLPTTFALAFLLHAMPFFRRWILEGRYTDLLSGTVVIAACTAGHHVSTLFGAVFFLGPVVVTALLNQSGVPLAAETGQQDLSVSARTIVPLLARRIRRIGPHSIRAVMVGPCVLAALVVVVFPYWIWSAVDPINQVSIPHGSRTDFLADRNIGLMFFVIPWGLNLALLPYTLARAVVGRMWPLAASIGLLFVLGTGGTTPIPKLLLGGAFEVLTLDRFTFWGAVLVMPLTGLFVESIENGTVATWLRRTGGTWFLRTVQIGLVAAFLGFTILAATLGRFRPFQPDPIDPSPIVAYMEKDQHERWRYLTLGFGDQMAWVSAQTEAKQVDGNYHSVRRLPELTSTSVERLEGAKYRGIDGLGSLQQFLEVPEKYHLKFVFSNDAFYDPLLHFNGWQRLGPFDNGIVVWERADIAPLPAELPTREVPGWHRMMWGVIPPGMILSALAVLFWTLTGRRGSRQSHDVLRANQRLLFGPFGWLDRGLARLEARLPFSTETTTRVPWSVAALSALRSKGSRPVGSVNKVVRILAVLGLVAAWPIRMAASELQPPDPRDGVEAYFDDLDFRRFQDAYSRLDPVTRPDYELWQLQLSVEGGLLASFAKLDSMEVELVEQDERNAIVHADLRYITALDWYPVSRDVEMVARNGDWFIRPDPPNPQIPPDQLVRRTNVDYLIQGRRRVTSATSDLIDIQDRPELDIISARLVERDGLPVVVGEITNVDVDPADLTVTAILRGSQGQALARYNATQEIIHTLQPRESTPFLINFQRVAAGENLDFDPLDIQPVELDDKIVSVEIYAKAVVTASGLYRGLHLNQLDVVEDDDGGHRIEGELRNDGTQEATIPFVLVSFLDETGEVGWVEKVYMETAIRSQRTGSFELDIPDLDGLKPVDLPIVTFDNGIGPTDQLIDRPPVLYELPDGMAFHSLRIDTATFLGDEG